MLAPKKGKIMPTGYTAKIYEGKETNFEEFALGCARAFGALASMREEPSSTEIPQELSVDEYYYKNVERAKQRVEHWNNISDNEIREKVTADNEAESRRGYDSAVKSNKTRTRYLKMLEKAESWVAPTPDHENFKAFMVDQLKSSIDYDCKEYKDLEAFKVSTVEHTIDIEHERASGLNEAEYQLKFSIERLEKEEASVAEKNQWLKDLREAIVKE